MVDVAVILLIFLLTVTFHEVAHGYVAFLRGDRTAYAEGRLTLNPFRHIDLFWTVIFPIALLVLTAGRFAFGMAKPVPVNFANLKRLRPDMILVAVSGSFANIMFAWLLALSFHVTDFFPFLYGVYLNLGLAFFNLIPIPPLDGSRVVTALLPLRASRFLERFESMGFFIIFILYITGGLFALVVPPINFCAGLFQLPPLVI